MNNQQTKSARREARSAPPSGSSIPFEDNKGNVMQLDGKLTIADLVKLGVKEIRLMPEGSPLPDNWWRDAGSPNAKLSGAAGAAPEPKEETTITATSRFSERRNGRDNGKRGKKPPRNIFLRTIRSPTAQIKRKETNERK